MENKKKKESRIFSFFFLLPLTFLHEIAAAAGEAVLSEHYDIIGFLGNFGF